MKNFIMGTLIAGACVFTPDMYFKVCKDGPQMWCSYALTFAGDYILQECFSSRQAALESVGL